MTIKTFIEKAIEGGWMDKESAWMENFDKKLWAEQTSKIHRAVCEILLDPLAWQAVSKVRGWGRNNFKTATWKKFSLVTRGIANSDEAKRRMTLMVRYLCDGKDLETALNEATS